MSNDVSASANIADEAQQIQPISKQQKRNSRNKTSQAESFTNQLQPAPTESAANPNDIQAMPKNITIANANIMQKTEIRLGWERQEKRNQRKKSPGVRNASNESLTGQIGQAGNSQEILAKTPKNTANATAHAAREAGPTGSSQGSRQNFSKPEKMHDVVTASGDVQLGLVVATGGPLEDSIGVTAKKATSVLAGNTEPDRSERQPQNLKTPHVQTNPHKQQPSWNESKSRHQEYQAAMLKKPAEVVFNISRKTDSATGKGKRNRSKKTTKVDSTSKGSQLSPILDISKLQKGSSRAQKTYAVEDVSKPSRSVGGLPTKKEATLCPVTELPSELLLDIFELVIHSKLDKNPRSAIVFTQWRANITITHVCHLWRILALNCPTLWTHIIFKPPIRITEAMLARSKGAPLCIDITNSEISHFLTHGLHLLDTILDMSRIERLMLDVSAERLHRLFQNSVPKSAPYLRSFFIHAHSNLYSRVDDSVLFTIPRSIYSLSMPQLQRLHLCACRMDWDLLLLNPAIEHLAELELARLEPKPSRSQLHGLLHQTHNLKMLLFDGILPQASPAERSGAVLDSIHLPYLTAFLLRGCTISQCADFHSYVYFHATSCKIDFVLSCADLVDDAKSSLRTILSSCGISSTHSLRQAPVALLDDHAFVGMSISLTLWEEGYRFQRANLDPRDADLCIQIIDLYMLPTGRFSLFQDLAIPRLTTLITRLEVDWLTSEDWADLFSNHPDIRDLDIFCENPLPIISGLYTPQPDPKEMHSKQLQRWQRDRKIPAHELPDCSCIVLRKLDTVALRGFGENMSKQEHQRALNKIVKVLHQYRIHFYGIDTLKLVEFWSMNDKVFRRLDAEVMEEVIWDGVRMYRRASFTEEFDWEEYKRSLGWPTDYSPGSS